METAIYLGIVHLLKNKDGKLDCYKLVYNLLS